MTKSSSSEEVAAGSPSTLPPRALSRREKFKIVFAEVQSRWKELGKLPGAESPALSLRPLTPRYDPELHGPYVEVLLAALEQDGVHNIALAGRYGAGKSSILEGLLQRLDEEQREKRTVVLSLSTLDPEAPVGATQAAARSGEDGEGPDLSLAMTKTNRVQKELVKQLLYREQPHRLPHSRFQRLRNRTWRSSAVVGGVLMAVLTTLATLTSSVPALAGTARGTHTWQWWVSYGLLFVIGAASFALIHWFVWERFVVRRVSAGGANIELAPRSTSYFDQYLDEITYFFEVTKTNLVVFEDLDRFDDHHIFQSLRDLNTLLNHSAQRQRRRWLGKSPYLPPVRFIYATRDSIFEISTTNPEFHATSPSADPASATRTKFFELVVPIVPFITPVSSRGLLIEELSGVGGGGVSRDLQALVAEQLTDMRLLRNIANEYRVFHHRLFTQGKKAPGLTEDALFALIVLKNLHPGEFEAVTRGESKLNSLYEHAQDCVENDLRVLRRERDRLRDGEDYASVTKTRARRAGEALELHLGGRSLQVLDEDPVTWLVSLEGEPPAEQNLKEPGLWRRVAQAQSDVEFTAQNAERANIGGGPQRVSLQQLRRVTGLRLQKGSWDAPDADELLAEVQRLDRLIEDTPTFDFAKLASQGNRSDPERAEDNQVISLAAWMDEHLADFPLVAALVRRGYIGQDFAAFVGESDTSLPPTVRTFIFQHVNTNDPFFDYNFAGRTTRDAQGSEDGSTSQQVDAERRAAIGALLAETNSFLDTRAAYSRELMDYLLQEEQGNRVDRVIARLCSRTEEAERDFIRKYLGVSEHRGPFVARLAPRWPGTFSTLHDLFDTIERNSDADTAWTAALGAANPEVDYDLTDDVISLLADQHPDIAAIREPQDGDTADGVIAVMRMAGVRLPDLAVVSTTGDLRSKVVDAMAYEINTKNLALALDPDLALEPDGKSGSSMNTSPDLSLERILERQRVWEYCRDNPEDYLEALPDGQHTLKGPDTLVKLVEAVDGHWDDETLRKVLAASDPAASLPHLDQDAVAPARWTILAGTNRFAATTDNLDAYLRALNAEGELEVDAHLAHLLQEQREVTLSEDAEEETKVRIGSAILKEKAVLDPEERARLVASLRLGHSWPLELVPAVGALLLPMLERDLLPETKETFKHFLDGSGWSAIETAASKCEDFASFLSPDFLGTAVTELAQSPNTNPEVRQEVLRRFDEFFPNSDPDSLRPAAAAAAEYRVAIPAASAVRIAQFIGPTDPGTVLRLLSSQSADALPETQLREALGSLPEPWVYFQNRAAESFSAPEDEASEAMLGVLEEREMAKWDRRRSDRQVKLL